MSSLESNPIKLRYEDGIATILLNRPNNLNIFNSQALEELNKTLDEIEQNPKVKVDSLL